MWAGKTAHPAENAATSLRIQPPQSMCMQQGPVPAFPPKGPMGSHPGYLYTCLRRSARSFEKHLAQKQPGAFQSSKMHVSAVEMAGTNTPRGWFSSKAHRHHLLRADSSLLIQRDMMQHGMRQLTCGADSSWINRVCSDSQDKKVCVCINAPSHYSTSQSDNTDSVSQTQTSAFTHLCAALG